MTGIKSFYEYQTFFGDDDTSKFDIDFDQTLMPNKTQPEVEMNKTQPEMKSSNSNKNSQKFSQKSWSQKSETLKLSQESCTKVTYTPRSSESSLKNPPQSLNSEIKVSQGSSFSEQNSQKSLNLELESSPKKSKSPRKITQRSQNSPKSFNSDQNSQSSLNMDHDSLKIYKNSQSHIPSVGDNNTPSSLASFPNLIPLNQGCLPETRRPSGTEETIEPSQISPVTEILDGKFILLLV